MHLQHSSFLFLFISLLFSYMAIKVLKQSKTKISTRAVPPGPPKLPLIGNLHQLVGPLPHCTLRDLAKKYGGLMHLQLGELSTIVISTPEIAEEIIKIHDLNFAQKACLLSDEIMCYNKTDITCAPYGNYWRQLRKICSLHLLSACCVQSFRSIREEEVSDLIKTIYSSEGSPINLSKKIFSTTYSIVSRAAFGRVCEGKDAYASIVVEFLKMAAGFCIADLYPSIPFLEVITGLRPKLEKLHKEREGIFQRIIDEHKERKEKTKSGEGKQEKDLVDVLLQLQEDGDFEFSLTDKTIKAVIWDVFSAGGETSSTTSEWAMSEMIKNPRVMKQAQSEVRRVYNKNGNVDESHISELKYLRAVIKETLRLHPPVPLIPRECIESCEINGYKIPVKTKVLVNTWAIGRDPSYWSEPETFYPERFIDSSIDVKGTNFEYIPFGGGRRICPGISFAMPNIELALAQLLYHFDWKLPGGLKQEDLDMTEAFSLTVRRKDELVLVPIPYCN